MTQRSKSSGHPPVFRRRTGAVLVVAALVAPATPVLAQAAKGGGDMEEVVVTGSYIRRNPQAETATALSIVSSEDLAAQAVVTVADMVKNMSINTAAQFQVDSLGQNLTSGTSSVNLRGLGLGSTLVMINGRRHTLSALATGDGVSFVDTNSLMPMIMVDRVEVLKDGAAATYGSDAVAGVVNFITRNRFDGAEIQLGYNKVANSGAHDTELSGIWGGGDGGTHWVAAFSALDRTPLRTPDRPWTLASTYNFPTWAAVSSYGRPGNYLVPGLGRRPDANCGTSASSYLRNGVCMFDYSPYFDLSPKEQRQQLYGVLTHNFGTVKGTLEMGYAHTDTETIASPSFAVLTMVPIIPASHPDNPYGKNVSWFGRVLGGPDGPSVAKFKYDTYRLAGSLTGGLKGSWVWDADVSYSQQDANYDRPDTRKSRLTLALNGFGGSGCNPATGVAGTGPCHYFNPFGTSYTGTGTLNSSDLLSWMTGNTGLRARSTLISSNLVFSGDLFAMSGGTAAAAIGLHQRRETLRNTWSPEFNANDLGNLGGGGNFDVSRNIYGIFGELKLPLHKTLEAQLSARYEDYGHGMDSLDPKVSLLWRPLDTWSFRTSASTAFRAPSLLQANGVQSSNPLINDPVTGTSYYANVQTQGNGSLKPEKADVFSLGATWVPVENAEISLDYWSFHYKDLIVKENAQDLVSTGTRVVRDPVSNAITMVQANFINASSVNTDGLDLDSRYKFATTVGEIGLGAQWTYILTYDLKTTANSRVVDGVGSLNSTNFAGPVPKQRGTLSATWKQGNQSAAVFWRYIDSYRNDRAGAFITARNISAWKTVDLQYKVDFRGLFPGNGTTSLTVGGTNITNRNPPFAQLLLAYDPKTADPRGRVLYFNLKHSF
ncbi:MAG: TonB-dependent receptor [Proteobacteria bacterium]|nr:TonB-dependent receptor [Pseudomonadota bacterium]HQR04850.1 TonB-dependent receptor [Rhodocyclaceae bacterium]